MNKNIFPFILLLTLTVISSCEKGDSLDDEAAQNTAVNDWILKNMEIYYFWNDKIPAKTNKNLSPEPYFESLLNKPEDRFSWIQENFIELMEQLSGIQREAGYDFTLFQQENTTNVFGIINYVKPNSPASQTGLRRGDIFLTVNGKQLTISNYGTLLSNALSSTHTLGILDIEQETINEVSLSVVRYEENPILLDTIYEIRNTKIGYLMYNFFADDKGDNSLAYAKELNTVFGTFKTAGINELILDLRYNSGGALTTSLFLANMIANRKSSELFAIIQYNSILSDLFKQREGDDYNKLYFTDNLESYDETGKVIESVPINKLTGLKRLYVFSSYKTASASELLINGLKPYMEVVLLGYVTYGKNVGSTTIYEEDPQKQKNNTWGIQPIIAKIANANNFSDYGNGFTPDVEVNEYSVLPLSPLGDTNEIMLHAALVHIGVETQQAASLRSSTLHRPVGSSMDRTPARNNLYIPPKMLQHKNNIQ
jgi:C-terminal processing protease CtpA/Prc